MPCIKEWCLNTHIGTPQGTPMNWHSYTALLRISLLTRTRLPDHINSRTQKTQVSKMRTRPWNVMSSLGKDIKVASLLVTGKPSSAASFLLYFNPLRNLKEISQITLRWCEEGAIRTLVKLGKKAVQKEGLSLATYIIQDVFRKEKV